MEIKISWWLFSEACFNCCQIYTLAQVKDLAVKLVAEKGQPTVANIQKKCTKPVQQPFELSDNRKKYFFWKQVMLERYVGQVGLAILKSNGIPGIWLFP